MNTRRKVSGPKKLESVWVIRQVVDGVATYSNGKPYYTRMVNRNFKFFTSEEAVISHIEKTVREMKRWGYSECIYANAEIVKIDLKEDSVIPFSQYGK